MMQGANFDEASLRIASLQVAEYINQFMSEPDRWEHAFSEDYETRKNSTIIMVKNGTMPQNKLREGWQYYARKGLAAAFIGGAIICVTMPEQVMAGGRHVLQVMESKYEKYTEIILFYGDSSEKSTLTGEETQSEEDAFWQSIYEMIERWTSTYENRDGEARFLMMTPELQERVKNASEQDMEEWMPQKNENGNWFMPGNLGWQGNAFEIDYDKNRELFRKTNKVEIEITYTLRDSGGTKYVFVEKVEFVRTVEEWLVSDCKMISGMMEKGYYETAKALLTKVKNKNEAEQYRKEPKKVAENFATQCLQLANIRLLQVADAEINRITFEDKENKLTVTVFRPFAETEFYAVLSYSVNGKYYYDVSMQKDILLMNSTLGEKTSNREKTAYLSAPKGLEEDESERDEKEDRIRQVFYDETHYFIINQTFFSEETNATIGIDTEGELQEIDVGNEKLQIYIKGERVLYLWIFDTGYVVASSNLPKEEGVAYMSEVIKELKGQALR